MEKFDIAKYAAIVLAAGKGTRMASQKPKVLQSLLGEPMLFYVLTALKPLFCKNIWIISGHEAEKLASAFPENRFIIQTPQLGTGHAACVALQNPEIANCEFMVIINGDTPLLSGEIIQKFMGQADDCDLAFATLNLKNPAQFGRVIRKNGEPVAIVEFKDFDSAKFPDWHDEVNAGLYMARTSMARELLTLVTNNNKSGEYYITDLVGLALEKGLKVKAIPCGQTPDLLGVNTPAELAAAENILADRQVAKLLGAGVVVHAPQLVRCGPRVKIEPGCEITGPCELYGQTDIASGVIIDSHCVIRNSVIGSNCHIASFSHIDNAQCGENTRIGPFARLRPGAELAHDAHVGNFVELKKTVLGAGSKANHLAYLGDSIIGPNTNIGAGTITCNYDGKKKHETNIGKNVFIGSNSALVAPVTIGDNALVGAGSVITKDVPEREWAIARARQQNFKPKLKK